MKTIVACILILFLQVVTCDEQDDADVACGYVGTKPMYLTESEGYFESPNYPDQYVDYLDCRWVIQPTDVPANHVLWFEIIDFYTESVDDLEFYVGDDGTTGDMIFELDYGETAGIIIPTREEVVTARFYTDHSVTYRGFRMHYFLAEKSPVQDMSEIACSSNRPAVVTNDTNLIESLNYPGNYPNMDCQWLIQPTSAALSIYVTVLNFYMYDYLRVYDGDDVFGELVVSWYGSSSSVPAGRTVLITSGSAFFDFNPSYDNYYQGFQLVYFLADEACVGGSARQIIATGEPGDLSSPGYPYTLPSYLTCRWVVRAEDENQKVLLQMQFMDLHLSVDCEDEYLEVLDGDTVDALSLGKFCGNQTFGSIPSTANAMQLYFRSRLTDSTSGKTGFSVLYSSGDKPE